MPTPRAYMDACCIIEAIKGRLGKSLTHGADEADFANRLLRASRDGAIELYTSSLTVAEVLHVGDKPPPDDVKNIIRRMLMSGRDGLVLVQPSPPIVEKARDLAWTNVVWDRAVDRVHLASALYMGCSEFLTVDGRLSRKLGLSEIESCSIVSARETSILPADYRSDDLFEN